MSTDSKKAYAVEVNTDRAIWPFLVSLTAHLLLFGMILFNPPWARQSEIFMPSVIGVQMVDISDIGGGAVPLNITAAEKAPVAEAIKPVEETSVAIPQSTPEVKPEISVAETTARPTPKPKTALKYKTFKTEEVLKTALDKIEEKVEKAPPKPLEDTIKRLREQVAEREVGAGAGTTEATTDDVASGKMGLAHGSRQEVELIDLYRAEIAYRINANWAFSEHLRDRSQRLSVRLAFKVRPDGTIEDIFFLDRSGNQYLDDSALKAVMKSSPVMPHPKGLSRPFVELGLRFTPEGVI